MEVCEKVWHREASPIVRGMSEPSSAYETLWTSVTTPHSRRLHILSALVR